MTDHKPLESCIVIGAGIAGLTAARFLKDHGVEVLVLERSQGVGGRMATRRIREARFDHGAQFFTARDEQFEKMVHTWIDAGVAREWSRGFRNCRDDSFEDGYPRYCGSDGMVTIPKYLAIPLEIRLNVRVASVSSRDHTWLIRTSDGEEMATSAVIVTAPAPQALTLFAAGGVSLPESSNSQLNQIQYDPCIAVLVSLNGRSRIPDPGGIKLDGEPVRWMADNFAKGISPNGYGVTIHAGPEFSRTHWDIPDVEIVRQLLETVEPWLPERPQSYQVHRWRYSRPFLVHPKAFLMVDDPAPVVFAGDGFRGSKIEGAALSGLAAADALLTRTG